MCLEVNNGSANKVCPDSSEPADLVLRTVPFMTLYTIFDIVRTKIDLRLLRSLIYYGLTRS